MLERVECCRKIRAGDRNQKCGESLQYLWWSDWPHWRGEIWATTWRRFRSHPCGDVEMWRKRILGRHSSLCKSHKVEVCLNYKRNSKEAKLCENSRRWNQSGEREIDHIGSLKNFVFYSEWNAKPLEGFEQGATWSLMFWKDYFGDFVENRI